MVVVENSVVEGSWSLRGVEGDRTEIFSVPMDGHTDGTECLSCCYAVCN